MSVTPLDLYWVPEAREYLGISDATLRRLVREGRLPAYRMGGMGRLRFRKEDLDAVLVPVPTGRQGGGRA